MTGWDVDAWQGDVYARAGFTSDEPVPMVRLARALGLEVEVMRHPKFPGDGALVRVYDQWRIYVRGAIPSYRQRFACAHEVAEWYLRHEIDEHVEQACDALAAALIAPRRAFARKAHAVGSIAYAQLSLAFDMTETAVALRSGEVLGVELALVRPGLVRTRGERHVWPPADTIANWARIPPPGIRKIALTDQPRRSVLLADEIEETG